LRQEINSTRIFLTTKFSFFLIARHSFLGSRRIRTKKELLLQEEFFLIFFNPPRKKILVPRKESLATRKKSFVKETFSWHQIFF